MSGREFDARETRFGRYLEDFEVGDVYKHWPGKTITEADDHLFCMITMNHHPLHTDAHYARPRRSSAETWWSATWSTRWCWA
jgi:acyl dehydratase